MHTHLKTPKKTNYPECAKNTRIWSTSGFRPFFENFQKHEKSFAKNGLIDPKMTPVNMEKHKSDPIWRFFAHFHSPVIFGKNRVVCKWSTFCVILAIFVLSSKFYPNSGDFLFSSSFFVKICGQNEPLKMTVFVWHKCDPFCAKMRFLQ